MSDVAGTSKEKLYCEWCGRSVTAELGLHTPEEVVCTDCEAEIADLVELRKTAVEALEDAYPDSLPRHERDLVVTAEVLIRLIDSRKDQLELKRELLIIKALFGSGDNWRGLTASDIIDRSSNIMMELRRLQVKIKNYEPTSAYNGLSIEQWKQRAESAEASLQHYTSYADQMRRELVRLLDSESARLGLGPIGAETDKAIRAALLPPTSNSFVLQREPPAPFGIEPLASASDESKTLVAITMLGQFRDGRVEAAKAARERVTVLGPPEQLEQEADLFAHAVRVLWNSWRLTQPPTPSPTHEPATALCAICDHIEELHTHRGVTASHAFVPKPASSQPPGTDEASTHRRLQAYPQLSAFFSKYALGSKLPPSCFVCGQTVVDAGVTHLDLPDIQCCKRCKNASESVAKIEAILSRGGNLYAMHAELCRVMALRSTSAPVEKAPKLTQADADAFFDPDGDGDPRSD